jgi:hypothetical protein
MMPTPKKNSDEIKSENQKALPRDRKGLGSAHAWRAGALSRPVRLLAVGPGHSRQMLRAHESHCKISSSMIRKSAKRFSEKIMLKQRAEAR